MMKHIMNAISILKNLSLRDVFSILSVLLLFATIVAIFWKKGNKEKQSHIMSPFVQAALGVIGAAFFWLFPAYYTNCTSLGEKLLRIFRALLRTVQHIIRLFAGDDGYDDIIDKVSSTENGTEVVSLDFFDGLYQIVGELLFLIAPIFTFVVIIHFFKNIQSYFEYKFRFGRDAHIFSELNEKSLALAKSISREYGEKKRGADDKRSKKATIVFADIIDKDEEAHLDLVEGAREIDAILFRKDMESVNFNNWWIFKKKKRSLAFYLISDDEIEKIRHAKKIIDSYNSSHNSLMFFSDSVESKYFLKHYEKEPPEINVMRLNDVRFLTYQFLLDHGNDLFEKACEKDGLQTIHATIVGYGRYGIELLKALLCFCQFPGYKIDITVLDKNKEAESQFKWMCPDLRTNTHYNSDDDMRYYIEFKQCEFGTSTFAENIQALPENSFVFVCLGQDELNMAACDAIRCLNVQNKKKFQIATIIYNSILSDLMKAENICAFGDLESFYTPKTLVDSKLIDNGYDFHKRWKDGKTDEVCKAEYLVNEYNFYSSLSRALHSQYRTTILNRVHAESTDIESNQTQGSNPEQFSLFKTEKSMESATISDKSFWYHYLLEQTQTAEESDKLKAELIKCLEALGRILPEIKDGNLDAFSTERNKITEILQELNIKTFNTYDRLYAICKYAANIDHVRWNAYMRTEGFTYGEKNTDAKQHPNLVPVGKLSFDDCIKDI